MRRLRHRPQFQALLRTPPIARTQHFALHGLCVALPEPDGAATGSTASSNALFAPAGMTWLGAMTPKRSARRAVTRNAIKRQIYAVAALHEAQLPAAAHVVRLRSTFDRKQFISPSSDLLKQAVRAELMQLFARAHKNSQPAKAERADGAKALSV